MAMGDPPVQPRQDFGRLLISSPQGHSGKTIVTIALCEIFKRKGLLVQPFKKGPDYIDPSWLTVAAGRACRTLDLFLMPEDQLLLSFHRSAQSTNLAIVEGAMGLYDGLDSPGTTAEIARLLNIPIILVVNTTRMTGSIAALVSGYQHFRKDVQIRGLILNYVSGSRHERKLRDAVEKYCSLPVVGSLPKDEDLRLIERHMGLIPSFESDAADLWVERIGRKLEACFDLETILRIARSPLSLQEETPWHFHGEGVQGLKPSHNPLENDKGSAPRPPDHSVKHPLPMGVSVEGERGIRIGVLRDQAFNFYYPENLEALANEGAWLIFINSFKDRLPPVDGLYIGGGFPEFFLKELEGNRPLRNDIARAIENGLPVYAECGGLMYLCRSISWKNRSYEMVGVIPSEVQFSRKPQGHGYAVCEVIRENPIFPAGLTLRGHEFHYSRLLHPEGLRFAYQMKRGRGIQKKKDGIVHKNLFASYLHLHALGTPQWAQGFVSLVLKVKRGSRGGFPTKGESLPRPMANQDQTY